MSAPTVVYTRSGAREMERAAAAAARAEAARVRSLAEIEVERARREAAARERDRAEADRARAAQRRAEVWARRRGWAREHRALIGTVAVVAASVSVAWTAQAGFYLAAGLGPVAVVVPVLVEGATWTAAAMASTAVERDRPAGAYRVFTAVLATIAASLNAWHGTRTGGATVGAVYGLASILGVVVWEAYVRLRQHAVAALSASDRRRLLARRVWHPILSARAARLLSTSLTLEPETAWALVWTAAHGVAPGTLPPRTARAGRRPAPAAENAERTGAGLVPPAADTVPVASPDGCSPAVGDVVPDAAPGLVRDDTTDQTPDELEASSGKPTGTTRTRASRPSGKTRTPSSRKGSRGSSRTSGTAFPKELPARAREAVAALEADGQAVNPEALRRRLKVRYGTAASLLAQVRAEDADRAVSLVPDGFVEADA